MPDNYIFIVSVLTDVGVRSSRTASMVRAFQRAGSHFPSAITAWNQTTSTCSQGCFATREELNSFFDTLRRADYYAAKAE